MRDQLCPADHQHGATSTCYTQHRCACTGCRSGRAQYRARVRAAKAAGVWEGLVPATGTRRRLQALITLGWSQSKIAIAIGWHVSAIGPVLHNYEHLETTTRDLISDLYERLWNQVPPHQEWRDLIAYNRSIRYAAARGWQPPLAWDDIDTDPEVPAVENEMSVDDIAVEYACQGLPMALNYLERRVAVRILHGKKLSDGDIAGILGLSDRTVLRIRQEEHLPAAVGQDQMPIAS